MGVLAPSLAAMGQEPVEAIVKEQYAASIAVFIIQKKHCGSISLYKLLHCHL